MDTTHQICKVLPEDSVVVLERNNEDGKTVNVRCGTKKLWMFARDIVDRCRKLTRPEIPASPKTLKLITAPAKDDMNDFHPKPTQKKILVA